LNNGEEVKMYKIRNQVGLELGLVSFGASVKSLHVNDANGISTNVVLGLDTIEEYKNSTYNRHFGGIVGRTANRISNSEFTLDGVKYSLDKNNGINSLHGGFCGLDMRNWRSAIVKDGVKFEISSIDMESGYPGDITIEVTYKISSDRNEISIEYRANTSKPTPIDLTNHSYFNLNGQTSNCCIYNHEFRLFCDNYLPTNPQDSIVTGEIKSVKDTKYSFSNFVKLGDRIEENGSWPEHGFDNYFLINQNTGRKHVASIKNPENKIQFDIFSDQNGVQFYTGNYLDVIKLNGHHYNRHSGFCLETHNYPNAVNIPHFPSSIVRPEGEYRQNTQWIFTTY
jgi:aldose 1-epimerase